MFEIRLEALWVCLTGLYSSVPALHGVLIAYSTCLCSKSAYESCESSRTATQKRHYSRSIESRPSSPSSHWRTWPATWRRLCRTGERQCWLRWSKQRKYRSRWWNLVLVADQTRQHTVRLVYGSSSHRPGEVARELRHSGYQRRANVCLRAETTGQERQAMRDELATTMRNLFKRLLKSEGKQSDLLTWMKSDEERTSTDLSTPIAKSIGHDAQSTFLVRCSGIVHRIIVHRSPLSLFGGAIKSDPCHIRQRDGTSQGAGSGTRC